MQSPCHLSTPSSNCRWNYLVLHASLCYTFSMSSDEKMFEEALAAIEAGNISRARDLLTRLLRIDQYNPNYWLWMSATVETTKERIYCLKQTLELDPQNQAARRGLILLGQLPADPTLAITFNLQARKWSVELLDKGPQITPASKRMIAMIIGAVFALIVLIGGAVTGIVAIIRRPAQVAARPTFVVFSTPTQTLAPTSAIRSQLSPTPTPPWGGLPTATPTAIYMATPHTRYEAYSIALRAFQRGEWERAITNFQQVATAEPESADVYFLMAETYRRQDNYNLALAAYNDGIDVNPDYAPNYLGRARLNLSHAPESLQQPREDLQKAIELDPNLGEAYLEMALINVQQNDVEEALLNLDIAAEIMKETPLLHNTRAQVYMAQGDYESALQDIEITLQLEPSNVSAYLLKSEALQALGRTTEAFEAMQTYVTYGNPSARDWRWVAGAYFETGDTATALNAVNKSLELDRTSYRAYLLRADIYAALDDMEKALKDYKSAAGWNTNSFEANIGYAQALYSTGSYGDAYEQFGKCRALAEDDAQMAQFYYGRALAAEALNNVPAAIYDWTNLLKLSDEAVTPEMRAEAEEHLSNLHTPTPTPRPSLTPTITRTPRASITPTVTRTPRATLTPTP